MTVLLQGRGRRPAGGSVFLFGAVMLSLAAVAIAGIVAMGVGHLRGTARAEGRLRAFYAAESGVQQVIDWFNRGYFTWFKDEYGDDPQYQGVTFHTWEDNLFPDPDFQAYFQPFLESPDGGTYVDEDGTSAFLYGSAEDHLAISKHPGQVTSPPDWLGYLPSLSESGTGRSAGFVEELRILRPPAGSELVCHVVSVGRDPSTGAVATVEVDLTAPWLALAFSPAALISQSLTTSGGLFQVRWGEVWSKGNLDLTNPIAQKFWDAMKDPWFHGRSEAMVIGKDSLDPTKIWYADGLSPKGWADAPLTESSPNYFQPFKELLPTNNKLKGYEKSFYQHTPLPWPEYEYRFVKAYFLSHDLPIYRTTADGHLITGVDENGNPVLKTFEEVFNLAGTLDPDAINPDVRPPLYFIDTIDGEAPHTNTDGTTNMATVRISGSGPFFYGYFFLASNLYFGGSGNSPSLDSPEKPDGTIANTGIKNCRLRGLFYSYGQAEFQGEGDIYGTLYAKNGFQGGGTWAIYFDWRVGNPLRDRLGSAVAQGLWHVYYSYPKT